MKKDTPEKIAAWMGETAKLSETAMTMEVLYNAIMERNPKATAYIYFDDEGKERKTSYAEWRDQCFRAASKLSGVLSGTAHESIVGIKIKNCPNWGVMYWAIVMTGHSPLLIDARLPKENTDNLLRQAKAVAIITNDEEEFAVPAHSVDSILSRQPDLSFTPTWGNKMIFCSSGTTGDAKMMIYEGKNLCAQVMASLSIPEKSQDLMYPGEIRILAMLPLHHVFGFMVVFLWYTYYGKTVVYPSSLATSDLLYACRKGKITHLFSVPLFWDSINQAFGRLTATMKPRRQDLVSKMVAFNTHKISKSEAGFAASKTARKALQKKIIGKHIRYCISGGGYLSPKTQATINGLGYPLYNGFGMTEVGIASVEMSSKVEQRMKGSIGSPFYSVEYKIDVTGESDGVQTGELMVKSPIVHQAEIIGGVYRETQLEDGWFRTGDIAMVDAQGNYFLKGRIKDTIILSNGENVYPDEIEFYFKGVKNINNCVCLGAKKPGEAEECIALICEVNNSVSEDDIKQIYADIDLINKNLPSEKKVGWVLVDKNPLPLSGSMKVKRFQIKKAIESGSSEYLDINAPKKNTVSFEGYDPKDVADAIARVTDVFSKVLMLPAEKIKPEDVWNVELGGDSMSYIEMCQNLNKEFKIEIPEELYGRLGTVNDFAKEVLDLMKKGK